MKAGLEELSVEERAYKYYWRNDYNYFYTKMQTFVAAEMRKMDVDSRLHNKILDAMFQVNKEAFLIGFKAGMGLRRKEKGA